MPLEYFIHDLVLPDISLSDSFILSNLYFSSYLFFFSFLLFIKFRAIISWCYGSWLFFLASYILSCSTFYSSSSLSSSADVSRFRRFLGACLTENLVSLSLMVVDLRNIFISLKVLSIFTMSSSMLIFSSPSLYRVYSLSLLGKQHLKQRHPKMLEK